MTKKSKDRSPTLTVLQSVRAPGESTNPYFPLLVASLPEQIETLHFSWRTALTRRYDVLHLHWPEGLVRGDGVLRNVAKHFLAAILVLRLGVARIPIVRTVHNVVPHDGETRCERIIRIAFDRLTVRWIVLNEFTPLPSRMGVSLIPHGHYREWFEKYPSTSCANRNASTFLYFGIIKSYKNVDALVECFTRVEDPALRLEIVGLPTSKQLEAKIQGSANSDRRIRLNLDYVDEETLAGHICAADIVILPYTDLHNSGAALLALSLDRPVLMPKNEISSSLRTEVGRDWIHVYEPPLSAKHLKTVKAELASDRAPDRPNLEARSWSEAGERHAAVFAAAGALGRRSR